MKIFFSIVGLILAVLGIIMIFDARKIAKEKWKNENINPIVNKIKVIGFIVEIIGWIILYFFL